MCDAGHVTLQLIHDNPKKNCFVQAGSIEIDFILEEIHIFHCPCDSECGSIECCNKCDRKKYRYPNIERAVHQCTTPIAKIKVVSSDCFKTNDLSPEDSSCNEDASYDQCDTFSDSYTNCTIIECREDGSLGKEGPKKHDEEFILKVHRRCSEQQVRRQKPESNTKKCYDQQSAEVSTRKCNEIEIIPKSRICKEKQNVSVYQKKWNEKQLAAICPRDCSEKKIDAVSPRRCNDNEIVAIKARCKEQQAKLAPKRPYNVDGRTNESAQKCQQFLSNRQIKKCPINREPDGGCKNPLRRVNTVTDRCKDTSGIQERKISRKSSLDLYPKKCLQEKISRTKSDLNSDPLDQKFQKCLSERHSPITKKRSCSKIIECKSLNSPYKYKNNSVPLNNWNGKRELMFKKQNNSSDQTNCDVEIVSCSNTCNTDEMDLLESLGNCLTQPSFIKCEELIVDCDSKNIIGTCCDFRDCDSTEELDEYLECSD